VQLGNEIKLLEIGESITVSKNTVHRSPKTSWTGSC